MKTSNKKLIITSIVLLVVVVLLLSGFLIYAICNGGDLSFSNNKNQTEFDESFDTSDVSQISVYSDFGDINIKQSDSDKIRVFTKYGDEEYFSAVSTDGVITVENKYNNKGANIHSLFGNRNSKSDIDVYIPADCIDKIEINSSFGDVNIDSLQNVSLKVSCSFGNIEADYLSGNFDLNTDMGNVKIDEINISDNSSATSSMGDVKIKNTNDIKVDYDTSMGSCNIKSNNSSSSIVLKAQTSMGNVEVG